MLQNEIQQRGVEPARFSTRGRRANHSDNRAVSVPPWSCMMKREIGESPLPRQAIFVELTIEMDSPGDEDHNGIGLIP